MCLLRINVNNDRYVSMYGNIIYIFNTLLSRSIDKQAGKHKHPNGC